MRVMILTIFLALLGHHAIAQNQSAQRGAVSEQIISLQQETKRLANAEREITQELQQLRSELNSLATQIEKHKNEHPVVGLFPDLELQRLLQQSQDLSDKLMQAQRQADALRDVHKDRNNLLLRLYDSAIQQTIRQAQKAASSEQRQALQTLASLRKERDALRQQLIPVPSIGGSLTDPESLLLSDDPEELSERADVVRDEQERLRRQLNRLEQRVAEVQTESRLNQELHDFVNDQNLFSEDSRTLPFSQTNRDSDRSMAADPGSKNDETPQDFDGSTNNSFGGSSTSGTTETSSVRIKDGQTTLRVNPSGQPSAPMDPATELRHLSQQQLQTIERIKKLQLLHDRLMEKSESLTK